MSIKAPGARLGHEITLEMARKRMTGQHKKSMMASLNLVAYIDMMTVMGSPSRAARSCASRSCAC